MNPPNINAENLALPPGHRWVDIANEPVTRAALFWWAGFDGQPLTAAWTPVPKDHEWRPGWSYCVPADPAEPATPEPDLAADTFAHADRLDLLASELSQLGRAFQATGNDRVADHLCRIAINLSEEATVSRNLTRGTSR